MGTSSLTSRQKIAALAGIIVSLALLLGTLQPSDLPMALPSGGESTTTVETVHKTIHLPLSGGAWAEVGTDTVTTVRHPD